MKAFKLYEIIIYFKLFKIFYINERITDVWACVEHFVFELEVGRQTYVWDGFLLWERQKLINVLYYLVDKFLRINAR